MQKYQSNVIKIAKYEKYCNKYCKKQGIALFILLEQNIAISITLEERYCNTILTTPAHMAHDCYNKWLHRAGRFQLVNHYHCLVVNLTV